MGILDIVSVFIGPSSMTACPWMRGAGAFLKRLRHRDLPAALSPVEVDFHVVISSLIV